MPVGQHPQSPQHCVSAPRLLASQHPSNYVGTHALTNVVCRQVPAWVTKRWLHALSREYPTLAFHASITNPFGECIQHVKSCVACWCFADAHSGCVLTTSTNAAQARAAC